MNDDLPFLNDPSGNIFRGGMFPYKGRNYSLSSWAQAYPDLYRQAQQSGKYAGLNGGGGGSNLPPLVVRPTSTDQIAGQWQKAIEEANAATIKDRQRALKMNKRSIRQTRGVYGDIMRMLSERKMGIESGYNEARTQLEGTQQSALADIDRGRVTADAASTVSLTDRGLFNTGVKEAMERRNLETANRSKGAVYADYGQRLAGLQERRTGAVADATSAEAQAKSEMNAILAGLRRDRSGILERTVREAPGYGDIAALYGAEAAAKAGKRDSRNQLIGGILGLGGSLLGGLL